MVGFIPVPQTVQDRQGLLRRRLSHLHRLEPPFQGRVLLNMLAVFIQGCRADALDFSPAQRRFQDVRGIQAAFRAAGADDRMNFVNEQQDIAGLVQLVQHVFHPLLKFAPVLGARHHAADIQAQHPLAQQHFRHIPLGNPLRQAFRHRAFAHSRFPDQHRIVLRPADQNLNNPLNLVFPADHRIQFIFLRRGRQIPAEFIQQAFTAPLGPARRRGKERHRPACRLLIAARVLPHLAQNLLPRRRQIHPRPPQQAAGHAVIIVQQRQPEMFDGHIVLPQLPGFQHAVFQRLFGPGAQFDPSLGAITLILRLRILLQVFPDLRDHGIVAHFILHRLRNGHVRFQQRQQQMFRAHIGLLQLSGQPLGQGKNLLGLLGEASENRHGKFLSVFIAGIRLNGVQHRTQQAAYVALHQI